MRSCVETIEGHVSIRKFKKAKIPDEHLELILRAGQRAPTDAALHLWTAIRVVDPNVRREISEAINQPHVFEASEFFVFLADLYRLEKLLQHKGEYLGRVDFALLLFAAVDAGIAAENMALAAESLGYGICFIGAVMNAPDLIIELLQLPKKTFPLFGLVIGVPEEVPERRPRIPVEYLVHSDRYHDYTSAVLDRIYEVMNPITRRRNYLRLIKKYAGKDGYFEMRNNMIKDLLRKQGFNI